MNSEKGIAHIVALIVLVLGLGAGLYLVSHPTILKPRAQEVSISPYGSYPQTPPNFCKARIGNFSLGQPCDEVENGFRTARYSCLGEITISKDEVQAEGDSSSCKSAEEWVKIASNKCQSFCPIAPSGPPPFPSSYPLQPCGGFIRNAPTCPNGYICKGGNNPDGPGVCVPNITPPPNVSPVPSGPPIVVNIPTPSPSPTPPSIQPPLSSYCSTTNSWNYPWQQCPEKLSNDSCTMNLSDGQSVVGDNFKIDVKGQRSKPEYYLSFWARNSKLGSNYKIASFQTDNFGTTLNTPALFDNGPVTLECRIESGINGPAVYSSTVTVLVRN